MRKGTTWLPFFVALITSVLFAATVRAACYPIGYASCPSGETQWCTSEPLDPGSSDQAQLACETCYGAPCFLETADCAGPGWGPNPAGLYECGDAYFGYTAGCSGSNGRVWYICSSYTTYGYWAGAPHCFNSMQDGGETGIDCGGSDCAPCPECGNGIEEMGEQCDDGNLVNGDCCDAVCQNEPDAGPCDDELFCNGADTCSEGTCIHAGDPCATGTECADSCNETAENCFDLAATPCDDSNACTDSDACDGAGACGGDPISCNDANPCTQDTCDPDDGCSNEAEPLGGCRLAGKSLLLLKNSATDSKDKLVWKWLKGAATTLNDLGTPSGGTDYTLCLYSGTTSATIKVPAGSGWQPLGSKGFKFKDDSGTPNGVLKASLKSGDAGTAKLLIKGKGVNLPDTLAPELALPVTAQLVNDTNSVCYEAVYTTAKKNTAKMFKAK